MSDGELKALFNRDTRNNLSTLSNYLLDRMNNFCSLMKIAGFENREYYGTKFQVGILRRSNCMNTCEIKFSSFLYPCVLNEVGPLLTGYATPRNASPKISTVTECGNTISNPSALFINNRGTDVIYEYQMSCRNNYDKFTNIFRLSKSTNVESMRAALYRTQYYLLKVVSTYPLNLMPTFPVWEYILPNLRPYFEKIFESEYRDKILSRLTQCEQELATRNLFKEQVP